MFRPLSVLMLLMLCCAGAKAVEPVTIGQLYQLNSQVLGEDRSYRVALPASYRRPPATPLVSVAVAPSNGTANSNAAPAARPARPAPAPPNENPAGIKF